MDTVLVWDIRASGEAVLPWGTRIVLDIEPLATHDVPSAWVPVTYGGTAYWLAQLVEGEVCGLRRGGYLFPRREDSAGTMMEPGKSRPLP